MSSHTGIRIWIEYRVFEYLPPLAAGDRVGCGVGRLLGPIDGCRVGLIDRVEHQIEPKQREREKEQEETKKRKP